MGQAVLSGFQVAHRHRQGSGRQARRGGAHEEGRRQGRRRRLPTLRRRARCRSRAAVASSTRCRPAADGGPLLVLRPRHVLRHRRHLLQALDAAQRDRPPAVRAATAIASTASTIRPSASSPIANALTLVRALPAGARVHLVTHSRGGLVAEVLARACGGERRSATTCSRCSPARTTPSTAATCARWSRKRRPRGSAASASSASRCPARGTLLASKRLDAYLSILTWCLELASIPVVPEVRRLPARGGAPARRARRAAGARGDDARQPRRRLAERRRATPIPGELRVIAGDMEGDSIGSWVEDAALGRLLLDRQRPRRADALDVRRRAARQDGERQRRALPARPGRQGLALQLLQQRPHGAGDHERAARRRAGRLRGDRPALVGRRGRERHARRARGRALARCRPPARRRAPPTGRRCSSSPASSAPT